MSVRYIILILISMVLLSAYFLFRRYEVSFSIDSKGIVYPLVEWKIAKTDDGSIKSELKDYSTNFVDRYSVLEFQRGDYAEFILNPNIYSQTSISKGDTIGHIISNELFRQLTELQGDLRIHQKLLSVYSTGAKQEEIDAAFERFVMTQQEYNTQKSITERNRILHKSLYISDEEYELSLNLYKTALNRMNIAKFEYESLKTGAKPEQLDYIRAGIAALKSQISHVESVINSFRILSPISGKLIKKRDLENDSELIRIADLSARIIVFPVELKLSQYIKPGQKVLIFNESGQPLASGKIKSIDNEVQMINLRQNLFVTAYSDSICSSVNLLPKMVVDIKVECENITLQKYIIRLFNSVYQN